MIIVKGLFFALTAALPPENNYTPTLWAGAVLIMVSLTVGDFSTGGWSAYPPFTELAFSLPSVPADKAIPLLDRFAELANALR